jgi:hypothetical protein
VTHRELGAGPRPIGLRIGAFFCALLLGLAGIAQAGHIHGQWLPSSATQIAALSALPPELGENSCPLCMAMHSALPMTGFAVLLVGLLLECSVLLVSTHKPRTLWYFAAFSRPPPFAR